MTLNKASFFLFFLLILFSCDNISDNEKKTGKKKKIIYNGVKENYKEGKLVSTITYKDSLKNGPSYNYYPNGNISMEFNYVNNIKHGIYKWFFENGKPYLVGEYKNGEKDGVFKRYNKSGQLIAEMPWKKGYPCKGLIEYNSRGEIKATPKIIVTHKNTLKLNNHYEISFRLSNDKKNVSYYEGPLEEGIYLPDYRAKIPEAKKGKLNINFDLPKGMYIMNSFSIIAKYKTRNGDYYICEEKVDLSIENR